MNQEPETNSSGRAWGPGTRDWCLELAALGSASELETQLIIAQKLKYIDELDELADKLTSVMKMINGLIRHYNKKSVNRD
jgi:hypothetical protein